MRRMGYRSERAKRALSGLVNIYNCKKNFYFNLYVFLSSVSRFRHLVQQLYDSSQLTRDWAGTVSSTLAIRVRRDHLLLDSIDLLKQVSTCNSSRVKGQFLWVILFDICVDQPKNIDFGTHKHYTMYLPSIRNIIHLYHIIHIQIVNVSYTRSIL
jgi:hypothetical protein